MGILRDPLHPKGSAPTQAASGGPPATPKYNRRSTDKPGSEDSQRYPAHLWPIKTREERIALLDAITKDLKAGALDPIGAYHERLRWAYRCMREGI